MWCSGLVGLEQAYAICVRLDGRERREPQGSMPHLAVVCCCMSAGRFQACCICGRNCLAAVSRAEHLRVAAARGWKTLSVPESFWFGTMSTSRVSQTS